MDFPSDATIAWLQLLFAAMWPGLLSLVVYRARVPGPSLEWKDSFVVAAFFTTINYLLLLPLALYVARGPGAAPSISYWLSAAVVLVVGPVTFPLLWSWLRTTSLAKRLRIRMGHSFCAASTRTLSFSRILTEDGMPRNDAAKRESNEDDGATARERAWIERSGAIARGDPNAPPPKAPKGMSGAFMPNRGGSPKK